MPRGYPGMEQDLYEKAEKNRLPNTVQVVESLVNNAWEIDSVKCWSIHRLAELLGQEDSFTNLRPLDFESKLMAKRYELVSESIQKYELRDNELTPILRLKIFQYFG